MNTPLRLLALALFCAGIAALLGLPGVAAQTPTDYDTDNDGLIEVNSLARLNAIRWDLNGDGVVDNPTASTDADDANAPTQQQAYATAFPNAATGMGCPSTPYDHDGNDRTSEITGCIGYELTGNLNFNNTNWASGRGDGKGWVPIGEYTGAGQSPYGTPFTRIFDGNNHTISNLYINRPDEVGIGLFGNVGAYNRGNTEIRNVQLRDVNVRGDENVGALVGHNSNGSISNSSVTGGTVTGVTMGTGHQKTGGQDVGGLAGSSGGPIRDSAADVTVTGRSNVGGLVGDNYDPITNSHASGNVSGEDDVGGLVGTASGDISHSYATGAVTGPDGASTLGGLVGLLWRDTISNSYATGNVTGHVFVGGLLGIAWGGNIQTSYATGNVTGVHIETNIESDGETIVLVDPSGRIGGLVGSNRGATISTSFASGAVEGMHHVGGLVGENIGSTIRATYAHGAVTATGAAEGSSCQSDRDPGCRIGGLVGTNINGGAIINSYAIGQLIVDSSHNRVGGLAGESPIGEALRGTVGYVDPGTITAQLLGYRDPSRSARSAARSPHQ